MNARILPETWWYFLLPLILVIVSCEDFQTKSYSMTEKDSRACVQLKDTTFQVTFPARLTNYNPDWRNDQISQIAGEVIAALADDSLIVSENDLAYLMPTGEGKDTTYILLESQANSVTLYFDQAVEQNLIAQDGVLLLAADAVIPLETIGGCTQLEKDTYIPVIQRRSVYNLSANQYLIQLIKIDQTAEDNIRLSVIAN